MDVLFSVRITKDFSPLQVEKNVIKNYGNILAESIRHFLVW
jgi:hypothetical protein